MFWPDVQVDINKRRFTFLYPDPSSQWAGGSSGVPAHWLADLWRDDPRSQDRQCQVLLCGHAPHRHHLRRKCQTPQLRPPGARRPPRRYRLPHKYTSVFINACQVNYAILLCLILSNSEILILSTFIVFKRLHGIFVD